MANLKTTLAEFISACTVLIENAKNIPEIKAILEGFGYTKERFAEGTALLAAVVALAQKQAKEYGESYEATQALEKAREVADGFYTLTLKVARVAVGQDVRAVTTLGLYGPRKLSIAGWLNQVQTFYSNLLADSPLLTNMGRYGYTKAKIEAEAALVADVAVKLQAQAKESAEAVGATQERDKAVDALDAWASELRAIAKVAFAGNLQQLEKLGLKYNSSPKRKTPATPTPPAPTPGKTA